MLFPYLLTDGETAGAGEHDVQYRKVQLCGGDAGQGLLGCVELADLIVFIFEVEFYQVGYFLFIIHYKDFFWHKRPPFLFIKL